MLAEAVLNAFRASPNPLAPFGRATLGWDITMPTTVIPGVNVEVHLAGEGDQLVNAQGSRPVSAYGATRYSLSLRAPKASRYLGTVDLTVGTDSCKSTDEYGPGVFSAVVKSYANTAFQAGGPIALRGTGTSVDIGYNSFVVDLPLEADVPSWFNADVDVAMGFDVLTENGRVRVIHNLAQTTVSFGLASSIFSLGCTQAVEKAVEETTNGFLYGFIGPVIAGQITGILNRYATENLVRFNSGIPHPLVPYKFYDLTLTATDGLVYRYCPDYASRTHPDGGMVGLINP